ncbi:MAG: hypothetical protein KJ578_13745 [Bacteroidetes bacterium]|nr:hypothetical protein [Bacteroidota bacterium]MBU1580990.1 hypothetical protein [Bacteroidota bacterium]MBU2558835.1 hypothetical protein [Bacteroidota bacterium]
MATVDSIRNDLIDKILAINNKEYLVALNNLIAVGTTDKQPYPLTEEQELMLEMSEKDIKYGRTVPQDEMKTRTQAWLSERKA